MTHIDHARQNQIRNSVEYVEGLKALSPRHEQSVPRSSADGFWAVITNVCTAKDMDGNETPNYGKYSWLALKWKHDGTFDYVPGLLGDFTQPSGYAYVITPNNNVLYDTSVPIGTFVWMSRATNGMNYYCFQYPSVTPTFLGCVGGGIGLLANTDRWFYIDQTQISSPNAGNYFFLGDDLATGGTYIYFLQNGCYRIDISVYFAPADAILNGNVPKWTTSTAIAGDGSVHSHTYYPQKYYAAYVSCATQGGSANSYAMLPAYNNYGITTISDWAYVNCLAGDYINSYGWVDTFDMVINTPVFIDYWFINVSYIGPMQWY